MRKVLFLSLSTLLFIAGCGGIGRGEEENIVQTEDESDPEISIIPRHQLSNDQYKIILPYSPSASRGAITRQVNNRLDINELEDGLRRHSTSVFDPEKLLFEEGQYITSDFLYGYIDEMNPKVNQDIKKLEDQIQEYKDNPRVFSYILEQNYLSKTADNTLELEGISIGISLKSVYQFQTEIGGPPYYEEISNKKVLAEGERVANDLLSHLREIEELKGVPILIGLFKEEAQSSPVPGNYLAKTLVEGNEVAIGKWETVKEENVLLPSKRASSNYPEDDQNVKRFAEKVAEYFPNYVGVIGEGFYIDETLQRLSLEIPIEFYGRGEVVGFSQYTYGLVQDIFPNHYDIEVEVTSSSGTEAVIFRKSEEEEATVHLLH